MSREHEEMLARVRVSERYWCESDLYWRTNRWAEDGRDMTMKLGPIDVIAHGDNVGRSTVAESFRKVREADRGIFRR
ncbi:hypothetical protein [Bradyrhizobium phage BDU-MI-1]|nr:hypothetical protein [Bradyrhizobium phage BDU-MI-1]